MHGGIGRRKVFGEPEIPMSRRQKGRRVVSSVSDAERALFRASLDGVRPLPADGRVSHLPARPKPIPRQYALDERQALLDSLSDHIPWEDMESGDEISYVRDGLSREVLKKLKRGYWIIEQQLDLHGLTVAEARPALAGFLAACRQRNARCIRIIHGKGLGSKNREPVLRNKVKHWLMQRDEVLAFCEARGVDGGSGVTLAILRNQT